LIFCAICDRSLRHDRHRREVRQSGRRRNAQLLARPTPGAPSPRHRDRIRRGSIRKSCAIANVPGVSSVRTLSRLGSTTRGRREGWLTRDGLERICAPMSARIRRILAARRSKTPAPTFNTPTSARRSAAISKAVSRRYVAWRAEAGQAVDARTPREPDFQRHFKPISSRL
jgi:hypothetical protein